MRPLKVLVLSRAYPNRVLRLHGLWVERLVQHSAPLGELKVVAPVQYCPPLPFLGEYYRRFRDIEDRGTTNGVEVFHPRYVVGPGYALHSLEAATYYAGVFRQVAEISRTFRFDLIHAHFTYPDGVAAARLARLYGVPLVITEQAPWLPWMRNMRAVRPQALWAAKVCHFHIAISRTVRDQIVQFTGEPAKVRIIPDGVDGTVFTPAPPGAQVKPNQILFVGFINYVKGIDVLLQAMKWLISRRPEARLVLIGGNYYKAKQVLGEQLRRMSHELGLVDHVEFAGTKSEAELVQAMRESALLVLPSRSESFGSVLVEALACGTPVVATRCGGPEDIVTDEVGVLVPTEDPDALAAGLEHVLQNRSAYDSERLRAHALQRFAWDGLARQVFELYREALDGSGISQLPVQA